ncbi:MAG: DUF1565 domain-containing protein [Candidatus Cloacimonetes bacterium]|nr:DUF1565 domain-containing protein [Candidatus Cloacimonadota bacterium]
MRRLIFLGFFMIVSICYGEIIEVNIEGGGDYLSIQDGIEEAGFGDVVMVYPGRYFENIDYLGKTISVVSLEWQTGERNYIHETIIDGNQQGSCVCVMNGEDDGTLLQGFTLCNGIGNILVGSKRYGGGVLILESELVISNSIIENNSAYEGGGIYNVYDPVELSGVTIRYNTASMRAGGIASGALHAPIVFSETNRCSIYLNDAPFGKDICNNLSPGISINVIADTLTCWEPLGYDIVQHNDYEQNYEDILLDFNAAKIERIESDLYISPEGVDDNTGLTVDSPWRSLSKALRYIKADSLHHRTIHLAEGVYYPVSNGEVFPVTMRDYVSLEGAGIVQTIIDLENETGFFVDFGGNFDYKVSDMTIRSGDNGAWNCFIKLMHKDYASGIVEMEGLKIIDCDYSSFMIICSSLNTIMNNMIFEGNVSGHSITTTNIFPENTGLTINNMIMRNNQDCNINPSSQIYDFNSDVIGCEFTNNTRINTGTPMAASGVCYSSLFNVQTNIINCTFSDNSLDGPFFASAPVAVSDGGDLNLINTIIWGNDDLSHSVVFNNAGETEFKADHNIITGEQQGIYGNPGTMNWQNVTNWDIDPDFVSPEEGNYQLNEGSWAIDRGTLDLPEGVELPEFDAAGRVRIYGDQIDIGAYEWNPWSSPTANTELAHRASDLIVYPNPAYISEIRGESIEVWWRNSGRAELKTAELLVYNISGRKVYECEIDILSQSGLNTSWDFRNKYGTEVASALYIVRIRINGNIAGQQKVMVIK